ncbi:MAG: cytochrome c maturation protein CcmE [Bryobacteraceae bacterium]|nr:cytochrome c maturation protein CcmE [Bryobacteraceae bacterium]
MKPWMKFAILVVAIIGTLSWLAAGGVNETKTYYKTISEIPQMGERALQDRLRVGGDVEHGSIKRSGAEVRFTLTCLAKNGVCEAPGTSTAAAAAAPLSGELLRLNIVYSGTEPLPDTFRDGAQALADGKMQSDGVFRASKIQAKCASKYEGKPQYKVPASQTTNRAAV